MRKLRVFTIFSPNITKIISGYNPINFAKNQLNWTKYKIGTLFKKVQARDTKIPHSIRNLRYETRLTKWGINRLEERRV